MMSNNTLQENACKPMRNYTDFFHWNANVDYEGIPENLFYNSCGFVCVFLLFLFLRKSAFKNSIAEENRSNKKLTKQWKSLFYSVNCTNQTDPKIYSNTMVEQDDDARQDFNLQTCDDVSENPPTDEDTDVIYMPEDRPSDRLSRPRSSIGVESIRNSASFRSWFTSMATLPEKMIRETCGKDALFYLRFQRHIIFFLFIVMIMSICLILPINLQGSQGTLGFEKTTLANIDPNQPPYNHYMWTHVIVGFLFFPISILIMKRYSVELEFSEYDINRSNTLMITKIPRKACHKNDDIEKYFQETFPDHEITNIQFAYDVQKLQDTYDKLNKVKSAVEYCKKNQTKESSTNPDDPPENRPLERKGLCSSWCYCNKNDYGLDYYEEKMKTLKEDFNQQKEVAIQKPNGTLFISFKTNQMAKDVHDRFNRGTFSLWKPTLTKSTLDVYLRVKKWNVAYAPERDDIYWETLGGTKGAKGYYLYKLKYVMVNLGLLLFFLFVSTPFEVLHLLQRINIELQQQNATDVETFLHLPSYIFNFFPTIMIWMFTILLPLLISWADRYLVKHPTRSSENHDIMKKTFWYLIFMVIVMPTFGFTSLTIMFLSGAKGDIHWECIFPTDSGAFFVNYVITAGLIGCGVELLRLPEMIWYFIIRCRSKSKAELPFIQSTLAKFEFQYGEHYARSMMILCMIVTYSVACPMITPFGLLYFVIKHCVDRYNLIYAYRPTKVSRNIHKTVINFFVLSTVMLQFFLMTLIAIRTESFAQFKLKLSSKSTVSCLLFFLSVNVYSASLWAETCKKLNPVEFVERTYIQKEDDTRNTPTYAPEMLMTDEQKQNFERKNRTECHTV